MTTQFSTEQRDKAEVKAKRVAAVVSQRIQADVTVTYDVQHEMFIFALPSAWQADEMRASLIYVHLANDALLTQAVMDGLRRAS